MAIACPKCRAEARFFVKLAREENWRKRRWWHHYASKAEAERRIKAYLNGARSLLNYCNAAR